MKAVDTGSCCSEKIVFVSKVALFAPPAAWDRGNETCLMFSDTSRSFFQFSVVRTLLTNFVTLLHGNFVIVAVRY